MGSAYPAAAAVNLRRVAASAGIVAPEDVAGGGEGSPAGLQAAGEGLARGDRVAAAAAAAIRF